ncbi:SAP domain-containing protein [Pelagihabitans pacificus]|uniref:SAP domain-containing protein n=1 Tax=Pelagihabitans pacificus TaxID=2696054 RepID=UPI003741F40F
MGRPDFENIDSGTAFNRWYWLREELVAICKRMDLPTGGRKFELRDRITFTLEHPGEPLPEKERPAQQSKFDWARSKRALQTKRPTTSVLDPILEIL